MEPFIGEIRMVGFNYAPEGWAICDGSLIAISQNQALYALLGTEFGGDGRTTFALPDLRGRVPINQGRGPGLSLYRMGFEGGVEEQFLTMASLPQHTHDLGTGASAEVNVSQPAYDGNSNADAPSSDAVPSKVLSGLTALSAYSTETPNTTLKAGTGELSGQTAQTGNGQPFDLRQPYLTVNFIIATQGIFPPRQ
ncbi:phage tail protein [Arhodomonas sp. AD133]|uniref:phage tail protein n=1 Tax=Arhodomonas sp. AD133 TaxID=3415009 RepID=UPI003EB7DBE7